MNISQIIGFLLRPKPSIVSTSDTRVMGWGNAGYGGSWRVNPHFNGPTQQPPATPES